MNKTIFSIAVIALATMALVSDSDAQCRSCGLGGGGITEGGSASNAPADTSRWPCQGSQEFTQGNTAVTCPTFRASENPLSAAYYGLQDGFSPHPLYAYSAGGANAARINEWNKSRAAQTSWHRNYNYWRWNAPTALVVPPTAAFQSSYAWGVGQTRSMPINHQFGTSNPGGGAGSGSFSQTPYLPSSTDQLGVYPVRAPWSHQ